MNSTNYTNLWFKDNKVIKWKKRFYRIKKVNDSFMLQTLYDMSREKAYYTCLITGKTKNRFYIFKYRSSLFAVCVYNSDPIWFKLNSFKDMIKVNL